MSFFRLDRLLTLYFFYPLMRLRRLDKECRIPILMYHSISDSRHKSIHPYYETTTSPQVFTQHMKFLHENGYTAINLEDVTTYLSSKKNMNSKAVVITFDDGFYDFYTEAFPILQQFGFNASMFLPTKFVNNNRSRFKGNECLKWAEVRELRGKGVKFGSHTVNHPKLNMLKKNDVEFEVRESKHTIEANIGNQIHSFSYPYAFPEEDKSFPRYLRSILEDCGYEVGVTTVIGSVTNAADPLFMKRIPINQYDDLRFFSAKLRGLYDSIHSLQYMFRLAKRRRSSRWA